MRIYAWRMVASVLLVLAVASCGDPREGDAISDSGRDLEARQDEFLGAMAARDADRVAGFFHEAAVVHVSDMPPMEGRSAIRRLYGNVFEALRASEVTPELLHVSTDGGMAYGTGATTNIFEGPDGPVEYTGKCILVWRRIEGEWMIVAYGISSNAAGRE